MTESLKDKMARLAGRNGSQAIPGSQSIPPVDEFQIRFWFDTICKDRNRLEEAVEYFKQAINDGRKHMTACGNLESLLAETPGLEHFYKGILVDAQQIRRWLEEVLELDSARRFKWYMGPDAQRKFGELKTTEISKLVKSEPEIAVLAFAIRNIANVENHLLSLIEGFTTRNINLSRIVEIRKANLQDIWIDPTRGTTNE